MRLIALLIPESTGRFTENGARIGDITLGGTFAVLLFGGLFAGIFVGTIWVVVSPWLPRSLGFRVLASILLAIGLGAFGVVQGSNSDFLVLGFELSVVWCSCAGRAGGRLDGGRRCVARPPPAAPSVGDQPRDRRLCRPSR